MTGSTRMKSGTAQKLVLNMISTATMIKMGRGERQPNGEYAIDQPETDRSGGSHDCGRNGLGL